MSTRVWIERTKPFQKVTDPLMVYLKPKNDPSFPGGLPGAASPVPVTVWVIEPDAFANSPVPPITEWVSVKPKEPVVLLWQPLLSAAAVPLVYSWPFLYVRTFFPCTITNAVTAVTSGAVHLV